MRRRGMDWAGISEAADGFSFDRTLTTASQLVVCFGGAGEVLVDDKFVRCEAGQAFINPARIHHAYRTTAGVPWKLAWVIYGERGDDVSAVFNVPDTTLFRADPEQLRAAIWGLYCESHSLNEASLTQSWVEIIHAYVTRLTRAWHASDRLVGVWRAVHADLGAVWTLEEVARLAHLSPSHLRRICQSQYACGPMQYLTRLRMKRAAELLRETDDKMHTIARSVGYKTAFAFSTAFSRHVGVTPSDYRKSDAPTVDAPGGHIRSR
jgi:AraC-like DNA-binding protein